MIFYKELREEKNELLARPGMRQWGCEAVTYLTRHAMQHKGFDPPLAENTRLQTLLLSPLAELSAIPFPDVRQKQLDTVLHILHRYYGLRLNFFMFPFL